MTAVQHDEEMPTIAELTVQELPLSAPALKAGAHHFGKFCDFQSKEFMLCMSEERDPRKCLKEGAEVTSCAFKFFNKIRAGCYKEFTEYWNCLDHNAGPKMPLEKCRKKQKPFDKCVYENFGWVRPEKGYFAKIRLHESERKKPEPLEIDVPEWIPGPRKDITTESDKPGEEDLGRFPRRDHRQFGYN